MLIPVRTLRSRVQDGVCGIRVGDQLLWSTEPPFVGPWVPGMSDRLWVDPDDLVVRVSVLVVLWQIYCLSGMAVFWVFEWVRRSL